MSDLEALDEVGRWLADLEQRVAADGWDQEHALWLVSGEPLGQRDNGEQLAVVSVKKVPLPGILDYRPADYLGQMAHELRTDPEMRDMTIKMGVEGDLLAVALASESWGIPDEDIPAWRHRNWEEHPQKVEARTIFAVDHARARYVVQRLRGSDDVKVTHSLTPGVRWIRGDIPSVLEEIFDALHIPAWLGGAR